MWSVQEACNIQVVHDRLDGDVDGVNTEQIYGGSAHQVSHLELVFSV